MFQQPKQPNSLDIETKVKAIAERIKGLLPGEDVFFLGHRTFTERGYSEKISFGEVVIASGTEIDPAVVKFIEIFFGNENAPLIIERFYTKRLAVARKLRDAFIDIIRYKPTEWLAFTTGEREFVDMPTGQVNITKLQTFIESNTSAHDKIEYFELAEFFDFPANRYSSGKGSTGLLDIINLLGVNDQYSSEFKFPIYFELIGELFSDEDSMRSRLVNIEQAYQSVPLPAKPTICRVPGEDLVLVYPSSVYSAARPELDYRIREHLFRNGELYEQGFSELLSSEVTLLQELHFGGSGHGILNMTELNIYVDTEKNTTSHQFRRAGYLAPILQLPDNTTLDKCTDEQLAKLNDAELDGWLYIFIQDIIDLRTLVSQIHTNYGFNLNGKTYNQLLSYLNLVKTTLNRIYASTSGRGLLAHLQPIRPKSETAQVAFRELATLGNLIDKLDRRSES